MPGKLKWSRVRCLAAGLLLIAACGREEKPPSPPEAAAPVPAVPASEAAAPTPKASDPVPPTVEVLRLMPESALGAVAFPSSAQVVDRWLDLAKRFAPDNVRIEEWVDALLAEGARQLNAPDARSLEDLLRAKGVDPAAPVGLFIDTAPLEQAYQETLARLEAQPRPETSPFPEPQAPAVSVEVDATPRLALTFRYTDAEVAVKTAAEFTPALTRAPEHPVRRAPVPGVTIHVLSAQGLWYFQHRGWMTVGNSPEFLEQIAARFANPAPVRYGAPDFPEPPRDEAVALVRPDRLVSLTEGLVPLVAMARPALAPWLELSSPLLDRAAEAYTDDPLVVTLRHGDEQVELVARLDYARHPRVEKLFGGPAPLRLATLLPPSTQGFLSMRLTDETKATFDDAWFGGGRTQRVTDAQVRLSLNILKLLMDLTGNHVAVGVSGAYRGWPTGVVIIEVRDLDYTKAWLTTMGMSLEPVEEFEDIEIYTIPLPLQIGVYYAFAEDLLLLADDLDLLKSSLDLIKRQAVTGFFASFDPPYDPAQPRYNALVLDDGFIRQVLLPLSVGARTPEDDPLSATLLKAEQGIRQVRASRTVESGWRVGRVTVYLK